MRLIHRCFPLQRISALYYPASRIMAQKRKANGTPRVESYATRRSSQRIAKQDNVKVYNEEDTIETIQFKSKKIKQTKQAPKAKLSTSPKRATTTAEPGNDEDFKAAEQPNEDAAVLPPRFDSDQLPLPWKGRLGYVRSPLTSQKIQLTIRPVSIHIYEQQTRPSSHQEHAASPQSSIIATPYSTQMNRNTPPRTVQIRPSQPISNEAWIT